MFLRHAESLLSALIHSLGPQFGACHGSFCFARMARSNAALCLSAQASVQKEIFACRWMRRTGVYYTVLCGSAWKWGTLNIYCRFNTSSTAQGGGGSFKNRKTIGEVGCCKSPMAERIHWWTYRWLELYFLERLECLQWSSHHGCWM